MHAQNIFITGCFEQLTSKLSPAAHSPTTIHRVLLRMQTITATISVFIVLAAGGIKYEIRDASNYDAAAAGSTSITALH